MLSKTRTRQVVAALWAATLLCTLSPLQVFAQGTSVPGVDIVPADSDPNGPNGGGWFFLELAPGQATTFEAIIRNPATVPQRVKVYLRDLAFARDGTPTINQGEQKDVGAWGAAEQPFVDVPAQGEARVKFKINPPVGVDPGDHVGVVGAESEPQGSQLKVILQTGTRLYVTIPGDATRSMKIEAITHEYDSGFWPRSAAFKIPLRNTGRVRLEPVVQVEGRTARGTATLLSRSVEFYYSEVKIPWYGGPVNLGVSAEDTKSGLIRQTRVKFFAIPWALLVGILVAAAIVYGIRFWWTKRAGRLTSLQSDLRRLETLITKGNAEPTSGTPQTQDDEELAAIHMALKRARRAGADDSARRLVLALHEAGGDALREIVEALAGPGSTHEAELISAASSYGRAALLSERSMSKLPPEVAAQILDRNRPRRATSRPAPKPKARPTARGSSEKKPKTKSSSARAGAGPRKPKPSRSGRKPTVKHIEPRRKRG